MTEKLNGFNRKMFEGLQNRECTIKNKKRGGTKIQGKKKRLKLYRKIKNKKSFMDNSIKKQARTNAILIRLGK